MQPPFDMPVLRSREIISPNPNETIKQENTIIERLTPAKLTPVRRRSPRLAPPETSSTVVCSRKRKSPVTDYLPEKGTASRQGLQLSSASIEGETTPKRKRKGPLTKNLINEAVSLLDTETVGRENSKATRILSLRSGKKIVKAVKGANNAVDFGVWENEVKASEGGNIKIEKGDNFDHPGNVGFQELDKIPNQGEGDTVGNDKRNLSRVQKVKIEVVKVEDVVELERSQKGKSISNGVQTRRQSKESKGKENVVGDELLDHVALFTDLLSDDLGKQELGKEPISNDNHHFKVRRVLSSKDKGKDKVDEDGSLSEVADLGGDRSDNIVKGEMDIIFNHPGPVLDDASIDADNARGRGYKERFRDIAKKNASRFAHFSSEEPEENHVSEPVIEDEVEREVEDWPGPFSTAMKIIRDRESNVQQSSSSSKSKSGTIQWVPKNNNSPNCSLQSTPKLQDICLDILVKNAEAISSLESVPDMIRHKLSHMLCDSRKMNGQFLDLLVSGSPTEIRIRDCSWLTEEQFTKAFQTCETSLLTVLQLDQCGRCLPDYLLSDTLARSPNALPVLAAVSIKGACRLSDTGLKALIFSAPALSSINLGQCSLITSHGINTLADHLGSVLRELYLDDCQSVEPMLILPALSKLEKLEALSLAGIETVTDVFISELVAVRGQNFKELVLTDCKKLTDSSLKVIAEACTNIHALDLSNLCKLTDSTLGYLTNGCRMIGRLKLSRTPFSDEAIAAYLEASGESLKELSLNNIRKVGDDTAISLAKWSKNLLNLDLSWCRNLTNEALGLIVDSCLSLKVLKIFGCTQITNLFVNGHSNSQLEIIGLKMTPILKLLKVSEPQHGPLHYSSGFC